MSLEWTTTNIISHIQLPNSSTQYAVADNEVRTTVTQIATSVSGLRTDLTTEINRATGVEGGLDERITNLESRGRYLSTWNASTGLPTTSPSTLPYQLKSGDYYIVETVPASGTKYQPSYVMQTIGGKEVPCYTGVASTVTESRELAVGDTYIFDAGATTPVWTLIHNTTKEAVWGSISGSISNQTDLQNALNAKVNTSSVVGYFGAGTTPTSGKLVKTNGTDGKIVTTDLTVKYSKASANTGSAGPTTVVTGVSIGSLGFSGSVGTVNVTGTVSGNTGSTAVSGTVSKVITTISKSTLAAITSIGGSNSSYTPAGTISSVVTNLTSSTSNAICSATLNGSILVISQASFVNAITPTRGQPTFTGTAAALANATVINAVTPTYAAPTFYGAGHTHSVSIEVSSSGNYTPTGSITGGALTVTTVSGAHTHSIGSSATNATVTVS